jgi:hypothetical protein
MMGLLPVVCCSIKNEKNVIVTDGCSVSEYHTSKSSFGNEFKEYSGGNF